MNPADISEGDTFGRWTVVGQAERKRGHTGAGPWFLCRCACGTERAVWGHSLTAKVFSQSCGCYRNEQSSARAAQAFVRHGHNRSRKNGHRPSKEYRTWAAIKRRCYNSHEENYPRYGGRGIRMCNDWVNSFEAFLRDVGQPPTPQHSIDRIDCDGHYEPGNVRWATIREQSRNTRVTRLIEFQGKAQIAADWARDTGINRQTILMRIDHHGWTVDRALTTPGRPKQRSH